MDPLTVAPSYLEELMSRLTPRQMQIVELLAKGHSNRAVASILSISPETVKTHMHKMYHKLEVENRIQVVVIYTVWKMNRK
jgi:DNA-binding NarL/FixJ family response regulator